MKIEELHLSARAYNCLRRRGFTTVEQLLQVPDEELLKIRSFGRECLKEVREKLAEYKNFQEKPIREIINMSIPVAAPIPIVTRREKPAVYLPAELGNAIDILKEEYEKTRSNTFIRNPAAWALYHTWRRIESGRG